MEHYINQRIVLSKNLFNGGRVFIKWNEATKKYVTGNTASTAVSHSAIVEVWDVTVKTVRDLERQLKNAGFTEHEVRWNTGKDTYESIKEAGL